MHAAAGLAAALAVALAAAHADTQQQQQQQQQPAPAQLMALAFPGWVAGKPHVQNLTLRRGAARPNWGAGTVRVLAEPKLVLRTGAGRVTLVAGMLPAGAGGKPDVSQLTPMALAAYQFERRGGNWVVAARQGIFAWRGFAGAARLRAVTLSSQRQGVAVEYGSCWQGYCGTWLALYELNQGSVRREPAVEMALSGVNLDSAADCARRLQAPGRPRIQDGAARGDDPSEAHDCYTIDSSWSIDAARAQPGDLVIRYRGMISRASAQAAAPAAIDQRQVLRYDSGKYRAVSGFNPVPPI